MLPGLLARFYCVQAAVLLYGSFGLRTHSNAGFGLASLEGLMALSVAAQLRFQQESQLITIDPLLRVLAGRRALATVSCTPLSLAGQKLLVAHEQPLTNPAIQIGVNESNLLAMCRTITVSQREVPVVGDYAIRFEQQNLCAF